MIRPFKISDLSSVMQIWLDANIQAHSFIPKEYWKDNYNLTKSMIPNAEVYVYENDANNLIEGFAGIYNNHIAGIFVDGKSRSKGIGKQLTDYIKTVKEKLSLTVYEKNKRAIRFYIREQFQCQSENVDEDTGEKELFMVWKR